MEYWSNMKFLKQPVPSNSLSMSKKMMGGKRCQLGQYYSPASSRSGSFFLNCFASKSDVGILSEDVQSQIRIESKNAREPLFFGNVQGGIMGRTSLIASLVLCLLVLGGPSNLCAQQKSQKSDASLEQMIENGEFTLALQSIHSSSAKAKSDQLSKIAAGQYQAGATQGAIATLSMQATSGASNDIADRWKQMVGSGAAANFQQLGVQQGGGSFQGGFGSSGQGNGFQNQGQGGQFGGGTQADFTSLINLIQSTITPGQWEDDGGDQAITPYPNGVLVDAGGVMKFVKARRRSGTSLIGKGSDGVAKVGDSSLRMISLPQIEKELSQLALAGKPVPDSLRYLGGMYDIHYVTIDQESGDLFLVGPAGPWKVGQDGIAVNRQTGKAVLHLEDLVFALRTTQQGSGLFGCSIDERPGQAKEINRRIQRLRHKSKRKIEKIAAAVGPSDTRLFGVPKKSHAAWAMLAADYHMKLVAMGNLPSVPGVPDYISLCQENQGNMEHIRWWFTLAAPEILANQNGTEYQIKGNVLQLRTENQAHAAGRNRAPRVSIPAAKFVNNFNKNFQLMAKQYPLYGQLENLFEMTIAAQIVKTYSLDKKVDWTPDFFLGTNPGHKFVLQEYPVPREVEKVVQMKAMRKRPGQKAGDWIITVSGGVTAKVDRKFVSKRTTKKTVPTLDYQLEDQKKKVAEKAKSQPGPKYLHSGTWVHH